MPRLPVVSGEQAVRAFEKAGWRADRRRGSHGVRQAELHWYEAHGVGRKEIKIKRFLD